MPRESVHSGDKIDENLPTGAAATLQEAGFDADTVLQEALSRATDEILADCAQREGRVFVTLDLDFANIKHIHQITTAFAELAVRP